MILSFFDVPVCQSVCLLVGWPVCEPVYQSADVSDFQSADLLVCLLVGKFQNLSFSYFTCSQVVIDGKRG